MNNPTTAQAASQVEDVMELDALVSASLVERLLRFFGIGPIWM